MNRPAAEIQSTSRVCALLGHPVKHSASPAMQNAGMAALGLDWRYLAFDITPAQLRDAIAGARALHFIGLNLTVPHKVAALSCVDVVSDSAKLWGAINTIRFERKNDRGEWVGTGSSAATDLRELRSHGFNTDADAIIRSLREDLALELKGTRVLMLGAGGAGMVAGMRLAAEGITALHIVNRTELKALQIVGAIRQHYPRVEVSTGYPAGRVDLILNATSLGLNHDDPLPLDTSVFPLNRAGAVYDMIYRPAETQLLCAATQAGCRIANGLGMLLHQGAQALELWCGQAAPLPVMRRALEENVYG